MKKIKYTLRNSQVIEIDDFDRKDSNVFKVNIPGNKSSYKTGNGEGIFACADDETYKALIYLDEDSRKNGKIYLVKALNDSIYYGGLIKYGDVLAVEGRGENRPVVILDEIKDMQERNNKTIIE